MPSKKTQIAIYKMAAGMIFGHIYLDSMGVHIQGLSKVTEKMQ